jgi:hypothetical protein
MGGFDQVFRMRHHAQHVARLVDDAGDVIDEPFGIGAGGVAERNLAMLASRSASVSGSVK